MNTRWSMGVEDIPSAGFTLEVDSRDEKFLGLLAEVADGSAGALAGHARVEVEPWPKRIDLSGTLSARVPMTCARCLEGYIEKLERPFAQILARGLHTEASEEEVQLHARDLDRSELVGDTLDFASILREELMLAIPTKPLCSTDCKGICAGCGAELNVAECTCAPQIDDRWAALAALKGKLAKKS